MPRYLTINDDLQIVRGEGCGFLPGPPRNGLESVSEQVSNWISENPAHPDVGEAKRWIEAAAPRIEQIKARLTKEKILRDRLDAFKRDLISQYTANGDLWAKWRVDRDRDGQVSQFEAKVRKELGIG